MQPVTKFRRCRSELGSEVRERLRDRVFKPRGLDALRRFFGGHCWPIFPVYNFMSLNENPPNRE